MFVEQVALMQYSSISSVCRMAESEEYSKLVGYKISALDDTHTYLTQLLLWIDPLTTILSWLKRRKWNIEYYYLCLPLLIQNIDKLKAVDYSNIIKFKCSHSNSLQLRPSEFRRPPWPWPLKIENSSWSLLLQRFFSVCSLGSGLVWGRKHLMLREKIRLPLQLWFLVGHWDF